MDAIANIEVRNAALTAQREVRLLNSGLLERKNGEIVAHGWLDIESLKALKVGDYQREVLKAMQGARRPSLQKAVEDGASLPDIMIGMRGENYDVVKGDTMVLHDDCFVVDGLQRISALLAYADANPPEAKDLRIGAEVRFNTSKESEKDLFLILNTSRVPVSPNVILRNLREDHPSVLTLYGLSTNEPKFALYKLVCWNQRMARSELLTALVVARVAKALHAGSIMSGGGSDRPQNVSNTMDAQAKRVGLGTFRKNIVEFFEVIDLCFGIRNVQYKEVSPQLKANFLATVARIFSEHADFWEGDKLVVTAAWRNKLKAFKIGDPEVIRLCAAGTMALPILYTMIADHLNKGKRLHRLRKRG